MLTAILKLGSLGAFGWAFYETMQWMQKATDVMNSLPTH
jgi:hypothetical protein